MADELAASAGGTGYESISSAVEESQPSTSAQNQSPNENSINPNSEAPSSINIDDAKGREKLARGLASVLDPVMKDYDAATDAVFKSQGVLGSSIDRLTRELDKLLEDAPAPFVTQHAIKLSGVRKRVGNLNSSLQVIQRRMDNIDRLLSTQGRMNSMHSGDSSTSSHRSQHGKHSDLEM